MIIKINANDIYKITQSCPCDEMEEIFEVLPSELQIFAKYKVGAGFYQWTVPGDGWIRLCDADEQDATDVNNELLEKKQAVRNILANNHKINVDNIFTTPGDHYVFFRYHSNDLEIMLVAWDYKFPAKPVSGGVVIGGPKVPVKQKVVLVFREAGLSIGKHRFGYKTYSGRNKNIVSDEDGKCYMGELLVGKSYDICVPGLSEPVILTPEKGKVEYFIDVSRPYTLNVRITKDGLPVDNSFAIVNYLGCVHNVSVVNGEASIELPYSEAAICTIMVEGEEKQIGLQYPVTDAIFELKTPHSDVLLSIYKNGEPLQGAYFYISYNDQVYTVVSDVDGQARCSLPYMPGLNISVKTEDQTQTQVIVTPTNSFTFNLFEDIKAPLRILVLNELEEYVSHYTLIVEVNGLVQNVVSDSCGMVNLPELPIGLDVKVCDSNNLNNVEVYTIQEGKEEFVFHVETPIERMIEFTVQDNIGNPIVNKDITLTQNGKDVIIHLDSDGKATLSRDIFSFGEDISSSLNVDDIAETTFNLQLDENEDEYLIEFGTKEENKWWKYIGDILYIALFVSLIFLFWYFINSILA